MNQKEIKAKKLNRHTYYISRNTFEDNKLNWRKTYYRLEVLSEENGFKKYLLYDTSGNPVDDFYKYMNIVISSKGDAQRKRIAYSLKRLYECADIYEVDVYECPNCGAYITERYKDDTHELVPNYCNDCGQKFDWSGEE